MSSTFRNKGVVVASTVTTLYTVPSSTTAIVHALYLANVDGTNTIWVTVEVTDTSASTTYKLGYKLPVPAGSTLVFDKPINLETGDVLKITAEADNLIYAYASILEIT